MVYKEGGAPAVFQSPKCPRWKLSDHQSPPRSSSCQVAIHQGRRISQEDRIVCALDVRIPFIGASGLTEVLVGIVAIFDGHNGSEASDMASKLLLEYFILHTYFLLDATFPSFLKTYIGRLLNKEVNTFSSRLFKDRESIMRFIDHERLKHESPEIFGRSFHLKILKESLLRTIADIDSTFSKDAFKYNLNSGSTATVVLIVDGQILVTNLGDSKALLCSEQYLSQEDAKATALRIYHQKRRDGTILRFKDCESCKVAASKGLAHLVLKELTRDHRPDRDDEKSRVEKAGGHVLEWSGVPRVNGQLAVSRAIGDVSLKSYGVISAPEVTDWQPLDINDSYLVAASDGVFEGLGLQDICDLLWELENEEPSTSQLSSACSSFSLADCIINTAFERGSMDNMAAAIVPLRSMDFYETSTDKHAKNEDIDYTASSSEKFVNRQKASAVSAGLVRLDHAHPTIAKFDRLLIEGKHGYHGCYYLYENMKESEDYTYGLVADEKPEGVYDAYALPGEFTHSCGESSILSEENDFCFQFGMISDGNKNESRYPEDFASFLRLLESIPLQHAESNFGSFDHVKPDLRYILKKRFGRGAYGEVWLAFQWDCHGQGPSDWTLPNKTSSAYRHKSDRCDMNLGEDSSNQGCHTGKSEGSLFILKRIMVEKGSAVYLSGLREKYFGEVFLNASTSLGVLLPFEVSSSSFSNSEPHSFIPSQMDKTIIEENIESETLDDTFHGNTTSAKIAYEEGLSHIARYVESFESRSNEIWLVFRHEGISLTKLMYTTGDADEISSERAGHAQVLRPSKWWHWLKTTKAGRAEMRSLIRQLLLALKSCHDRNLTHRDIKPENMVICIEDHERGGCLKTSPRGDMKHVTRMRIIDFGSAIDDFTTRHLYGFRGPSRAEQTYEYTAPEALLNATWYQGPTSRTLKYDMWSVAVVFLEMVLGSPDIFQISSLSHALLDKLVEGWNEELKELAYRLRSFMEMCILVPGLSTPNRGTNDQVKVPPASWKCSEEFFSNLIKSRDPLHIGFPNIWAMRLVRQLLVWDPDDRLSVDEALRHPYFHPPPH